MHRGLRRSGIFAAVALASAIHLLPARAGESSTKVKVHSAVNPAIYATLPIILAAEKGYFADAGVDVEIKKFNTSSVTQMPLVARGDLDITNMVAGPALFNQKKEGFDIRIIASMTETHPGWHDGNWIMVRKDLWDSGAVRKLEDIKGHAVDGATTGSPINFLMNAALVKLGLTRADVTYSSRVHTGADMLTAFRNKAVDVMPTIEPRAAQMVEDGLAHRLASENEVAPWLQDTYFVSSGQFIHDHPQAIVGYLKAILRAEREIMQHGPKWTPEYVDVLARWSGVPAAVLNKVPGVPYYGQYGTIDVESLKKQEALWATLDLVKEKVDPATMIETSSIAAARKEMGLN